MSTNPFHHCPHYFRSEPTPLTSSPQKGASATPSSVKSLGDKVSSTPSGGGGGGGGATSKNSRSQSKTSVGSGGSGSSDSPYRTSGFYIIRVSIEENGPETEGIRLIPIW